MKQYLPILRNNPLFHQIKDEDIIGILTCTMAKTIHYHKSSFLFIAGDEINSIGIVLQGNIQIIREDILGNRLLLSECGPSDMFLEAFVCADEKITPVSIYAATSCTVLFLSYKKLTTSCSTSCSHHHQLIQNMLKILGQKNMLLNNRIQLLSRKTTRQKLMSYFLLEAEKNQNQSFQISFNRNELADYLGVDRSSMSRELSKMQEDELISYHKNHITLL